LFEGLAQASGDALGTVVGWGATAIGVWLAAVVFCMLVPPLRALGNQLLVLPFRIMSNLLANLLLGLLKAGAGVAGSVGGWGLFEVWDLRARLGRSSDPEAPLVRWEERRPMDPPPGTGSDTGGGGR
jgi:hypothetical protein